MSQKSLPLRDGTAVARRLDCMKRADRLPRNAKGRKDMKPKTALSAITLAALVAASFSSASFAQAGGPGGADRMPPFNFTEMDANQDGKVTKDEIAAFHAAQIAKIDANGDGFVTADELQAMHDQMAAKRAENRTARMIEHLDTNKDGKLSVAEMAAGGERGNRGDKMFDRVDTDNDGAISQAEADAAKAQMEEHMKKRGDHNGWGHGHDKGTRGGNN